ncbi:aldehyde dehydrogenase [Amycolatopsis rubida]|uniref:Aldehyde dehydrogenase n=1 Tax=Amycolatopsis rubida TaxID=112413 RepID=A0ABX0C7W7_9PSEU|nr:MULTISPECIES: aldehyde dehydrogenase [Amycolatopsis]MYW96115.1 aldehyde dehydrogenase family protein [Amycolatopsis rubida]NEC61106.1 aldehyde dehydrogenase [Amycolatopsis rubida]OAP23372.1 Geranial dehydrogenase [Amycolatopsis sp. M39]
MVWQGPYDKIFVGGSWVDPVSRESIPVVSPFTEQVIARVPDSAAADVDRAVAAARDAFDRGHWPRMALQERMAVLRQVSAQLLARESEVAQLVTHEMGCPITLSHQMQARNPRLVIDAFLEIAPEYEWSTVRRSTTGQALVTREPVGVVAAITPWNAPLLTMMVKVAPALLAGCTVVIKPAPEAPLSVYLFAEMLQNAGLPAGVVNIVPAGREVGEHLVRHPGVDKVSFTGSTAAGRRIASLCGNDLRRVTLELGGKSAAVILDDADMDVVIDCVRTVSMRNSGQTCSNKTRLVVPASREAELKDRLVALVEETRVGDPADPATHIGPLVAARQRDLVEGYIKAGAEEGAKVLVGGGRPAGLAHGWFVEPTIFTGVEPSMRIAQEEIFGPVVSVLAYRNEDEAVAIANDSTYGLSGSVFSADDEHALSVARRIRTGTVELNGKPVGWHAPVGGFKCSGLGREAGPEGFEAYVELKSYGLTDRLAASLS